MDKKKILESEDIDKAIEEIKNSKFEMINYWKILILEWIENSNEQCDEAIDITMEQIEQIAENLMNNDIMWNVIDEEISNEIFMIK